MIKRYNDSDESVEHRFDSYMKVCVKHRSWNEFRNHRNRMASLKEIPLDENVVKMGKIPDYPSENVINQIDEFFVEIDDQKLNSLLKKLPKRARTVIIMSVIYELSHKDIAKHLNIHHSTVWNYKSMGLSLMRKNYLGKSGEVNKREK